MRRRWPFAPVKTEIKMYLSLINRIHVPGFALWVGPCFTNHLWPRDLNRPRAGHQTAFGLTFDHPRGPIWPDGLVKISISSMDRVISATEWSDAISVEANNGFNPGAGPEKDLDFNCPGCKTFVWPFQRGWVLTPWWGGADGDCLSACLMQVEKPNTLQALVLVKTGEAVIQRALKCHLVIISDMDDEVPWACVVNFIDHLDCWMLAFKLGINLQYTTH